MSTSTGRGGAGNMSSKASVAPPPSAKELTTPTIKNATYTTGRGGSGNMAQNLPELPEYARASQDVQAPPQRIGGKYSDDSAGSVTYTGRGGGGNALRGGERSSSFNADKREKEALESLRREAIQRDAQPHRREGSHGANQSTSSATAAPQQSSEMSGAIGGLSHTARNSAGKTERRESASSLVGKGKELIDKMRSKGEKKTVE